MKCINFFNHEKYVIYFEVLCVQRPLNIFLNLDFSLKILSKLFDLIIYQKYLTFNQTDPLFEI